MNSNKENHILEAARLAIYHIAKEKAIRQQMEAYGCTPVRMQTGKILLANAKNYQSAPPNQHDARRSLAQKISAELENTQTQFEEHVSVARIAFRNDSAMIHLLKITYLSRNGWPCIQQAEYFYAMFLKQNLNLENYGISRREMQQAGAAVKALLRMKEGSIRQERMAKNSAQAKQIAFQELRSWVMEVQNTARLAFAHSPQILETFGIPVLAKV